LDREPILGNATYLAAAVSPQHALPLYAEFRSRAPWCEDAVGMVNAMAAHGHIQAAVAYLSDPLPGDRFPLLLLGNLERKCVDDVTRLALLQAAVRAWKGRAPDGSPWPQALPRSLFAAYFARWAHLLPADEAEVLRREIGEWTLQLPDTAPWMPPPQPHPEPVPESASETHTCEDAMMIGSCFGTEDDPPNARIIPMSEALANDFAAAFQEAFARYAEDADLENPNDAPKECWPSTHAFRNILFKAGQHLGADAAKYLDRIPDADLRLFAQVDLCAAVAGLPQIGGTTIYRPRMARRPGPGTPVVDPEITQEEEGGSGGQPGGPRIRCPKCGWRPRAEDRWACHCGHMWNTFDTGGVCPGCMYQWKITMCPRCRQWSAHSDWYEG
jgi:hypothetical protein